MTDPLKSKYTGIRNGDLMREPRQMPHGGGIIIAAVVGAGFWIALRAAVLLLG